MKPASPLGLDHAVPPRLELLSLELLRLCGERGAGQQQSRCEQGQTRPRAAHPAPLPAATQAAMIGGFASDING